MDRFGGQLVLRRSWRVERIGGFGRVERVDACRAAGSVLMWMRVGESSWRCGPKLGWRGDWPGQRRDDGEGHATMHER